MTPPDTFLRAASNKLTSLGPNLNFLFPRLYAKSAGGRGDTTEDLSEPTDLGGFRVEQACQSVSHSGRRSSDGDGLQRAAQPSRSYQPALQCAEDSER
jgi:hypothetical protein